MTTTLTTEDMAALKGVHPKLVAVVLRAAKDPACPRFRVLEGLRTPARQKELVAAGKSRALKSKHLPGPDGLGRAVDLAPLPIDWQNLAPFRALKASILAAARAESVRVRSGSDWDMNGVADQDELAAYVKKVGRKPLVDWPHYELVGV